MQAIVFRDPDTLKKIKSALGLGPSASDDTFVSSLAARLGVRTDSGAMSGIDSPHRESIKLAARRATVEGVFRFLSRDDSRYELREDGLAIRLGPNEPWDTKVDE